MRKAVAIIAVGLVCWTAEAARTAAQERGTLLASVGQFNNSGRLDPAELGFEWRSRPHRRKLRINAGLMINADKGGFAFAGTRWDFPFSPRWGISPACGVGIYEAGDGLDMGGPIQLRWSLELFHWMTARSRMAASFTHLSNAGIYSDNPGANSIALVFGWKLDQTR